MVPVWNSDEDEYDEPADWEADDWGDDDSTDVITCPNCQSEVYEDAEQCPVCGEFLIRSHRVWEDKPAWWIVLGLAGIIAVVLALTQM